MFYIVREETLVYDDEDLGRVLNRADLDMQLSIGTGCVGRISLSMLAPIVGSMDQLAADVTDIDEAVGDTAKIIDRNCERNICIRGCSRFRQNIK